MAESEGFEPPDPFGSTVFKTAAFDRSASSPLVLVVLFVLFRRHAWRHKQRFAPVCRRGRDQWSELARNAGVL
jgi:hypothetical protein